MDTGCCGEGPVRVSELLRLLVDAVRSDRAAPVVWFKEGSQRNLKSRDFLMPKGALNKIFHGEEVPEDLLNKLTSLKVSGVLPIQRCLQNETGLLVQLDRPAVFQNVLTDFSLYMKPVPSDNGENSVVLNCAPLHSCEGLNALKLSHLRAVLVADHVAELLRLAGVQVHLVPKLRNTELQLFLHQLGVSWPFEPEAPCVQEEITAFKKYLKERNHVNSHDLEQPLNVTDDDLKQVAELQRAVQESRVEGTHCALLHVVSYEKEFHQQKLDRLFTMLDSGDSATDQKHLICGPVKVLSSSPAVSCSEYYHLRKTQMRDASVMKYGDLLQGDNLEEIIRSLTAAAIKFEMMATAQRSQVTLDLEDSSITTKGTKSGAFVMYNCARLATMFDSYNMAVSQGFYPEFPPARELNYSTLKEEGEWLLLFNYIMTFPEVLSQSAQILLTSSGSRVTASTDAVCKFLVNLSMDFSSYYNRVHILGEHLPHLYGQMFARLQLMKAVQSLLHAALGTLHISPLTKI